MISQAKESSSTLLKFFCSLNGGWHVCIARRHGSSHHHLTPSCPRPCLPQDILAVLCLKGPSTEGVFRKAANEKARKELKEELSSGGTVDLEGLPVHLLAAVLKVGPRCLCQTAWQGPGSGFSPCGPLLGFVWSLCIVSARTSASVIPTVSQSHALGSEMSMPMAMAKSLPRNCCPLSTGLTWGWHPTLTH